MNRRQIREDIHADMVSVHKPTGTFLMVSPDVIRILGYIPEELLGNNPYEYMHPDDRNRFQYEYHMPMLEDKKPRVVEVRYKRKDGKYIWLRTDMQPQLSLNDEIISLLCTSRDVTEIMLIKEEMNRKVQLLEKENEAIKDHFKTFPPLS